MKVTITILTTHFHHHQYNTLDTRLYRAKETNIKSLELFIENIEKDIFDTAAVRNVRPNISKEEKEALKEIRSWNNQTVRVQDKGSRFVILDNNDYEQKIQTQIDRSSFSQFSQFNQKKIQVRNLTFRLIAGF